MKRLHTIIFLQFLSISLYSQCWQSISAGLDHTIAIRPDGTLWAWGFNGSGQLGDGTTNESSIPVQIGSDSDWMSISAGTNSSFAIKTNGTLWAWGDNFWGQLGDGSFGNNRFSPVKIGFDTNWESISVGRDFTLAIKNDGSLWAWGDNLWGQLGSQVSSSLTPTRVGMTSDWRTVAAGASHALGIKIDGTLWSWGYNSKGQLGDGTLIDKSSPVKIGIESNWQSIAAGESFSLAVKTDGTLWSWGTNDVGQLGNSTFVNKNVPTRVGTGNNWKSISAGNYSSFAIKVDGTLWTWGWIISSFFFDIDNSFNTPTQIGLDLDWQSSTSGHSHSFAFKTNGTIWAWGDDRWGKLAIDKNLDSSKPQVLTVPAPVGSTVQIFCSSGTISNLKAVGSNVKWYLNPNGGTPLSIGTVIANGNHYYASQTISSCESATRFDVTVFINSAPPPPTGSASQFFCGTTAISHLVLTGNNIKWYTSASGGTALPSSTILVNASRYFASQTVDGCESLTRFEVLTTAGITPPPSDIPSPYMICEASISLVSGNTNWYLTPTGGSKLPNETKLIDGATYYASQIGQCGESVARTEVKIMIRKTPPPVSLVNEKWISIVGGLDFSMAIRDDSTLWYWGESRSGSPAVFSSPQQQSSSNRWRFITSGLHKRLGIQNDGYLFEWDNYAQINSPSRIGNQKDWLTASTQGAPQTYHNSAIKRDGTLWTWGSNGKGQLGDGTLIDKAYPTRVGAHAEWKSVSNGDGFTIAIKTDGTLWAWGQNNRGQLGDGSVTDKRLPTRVGLESDWRLISTSSESVMGLRSDGSLWAWGANSHGNLGDGTKIDKLVPVKIGSSDWLTVSVGAIHTLAIKRDGTLWSWGSSDFGSLGAVDQVNTSIPNQVGSNSNWMTVECGGAHSLALTNDGILWIWGPNNSGQLGLGETIDKKWRPTQFPSKIKSICGESITLKDLPIQGTNIIWYWDDKLFPITRVDSVKDVFFLFGKSRFFATQTIDDVESCQPLSVFLDRSLPETPFGNQVQAFCPGATVSNLVVKGNDIKWYDSRGNRVSLTTPLENNSRYEATQMVNSCESKRLQVLVVSLTAPRGALAQTLCLGSKISDLVATGTDIKWYTTVVGGTPLLPTFFLTNGARYYASQTANLCESQSRLEVSVTLNDTSAPSGSTNQSHCEGSTVSNLSATGTNIKWYSSSNSVLPLAPSTILTTGTHYYASQTVNSCESSARMDVTVILQPSPPAPTGANEQSFEDGKTIGDIIVTGTDIKWYKSEEDASNRVNTLPNQTLVSRGASYYATQTFLGCESLSWLKVTFSPITGVEMKVLIFKYYPNPVTDALYITSETEIMEVCVTNLIGQVFFSKKINSHEAVIDFSNLGSSVYLIHLQSNNEIRQIKVIKR